MILEIAQIEIKPGMEADFEAGIAKASSIFKEAKGCRAFAVERSIEHPSPLPADDPLGHAGGPHQGFHRLPALAGLPRSGRALLFGAGGGRAHAAGAEGVLTTGARSRPPPAGAKRTCRIVPTRQRRRGHGPNSETTGDAGCRENPFVAVSDARVT